MRVAALIGVAAAAAMLLAPASPAVGASAPAEYRPGLEAPPVPPLTTGSGVVKLGPDVVFGETPSRFAGSRAARALAESIADAARAGRRTVVIEGFTEGRGSPESGWAVAAQRAVFVRNAVQVELAEFPEAAGVRFVIRAFGMSAAAGDLGDEEPRGNRVLLFSLPSSMTVVE